jgi:hypothetical protein
MTHAICPVERTLPGGFDLMAQVTYDSLVPQKLRSLEILIPENYQSKLTTHLKAHKKKAFGFINWCVFDMDDLRQRSHFQLLYEKLPKDTDLVLWVSEVRLEHRLKEHSGLATPQEFSLLKGLGKWMALAMIAFQQQETKTFNLKNNIWVALEACGHECQDLLPSIPCTSATVMEIMPALWEIVNTLPETLHELASCIQTQGVKAKETVLDYRIFLNAMKRQARLVNYYKQQWGLEAIVPLGGSVFMIGNLHLSRSA